MEEKLSKQIELEKSYQLDKIDQNQLNWRKNANTNWIGEKGWKGTNWIEDKNIQTHLNWRNKI